jgi:hypothetical protein
MMFAKLKFREGLRGIHACLHTRPRAASRMGIRGRVTRTNLAYANDHREWRVFTEVTAVLIYLAQRLYAGTPPTLGLEAGLFALDPTVIDLSLVSFPGARWQQCKAFELFFRWLNQHLRLRGFFDTSPNSIWVQIWAALSAYLLVAIAKQRKHLPLSLWEILQFVSILTM